MKPFLFGTVIGYLAVSMRRAVRRHWSCMCSIPFVSGIDCGMCPVHGAP